jgi:NifU-like protein involved in Fe-S cluster formation
MLKENGPPPSGRWSDLEALLPVRDFKARHASTLLTFDAVCEAVDKAMGRSAAIEAKAGVKSG